MTRVGVVGATGYAGAELVRIVSGHPDAELTIITSRQYSGEKFGNIYPSMAGSVNLACEEFEAGLICEKADVIFMALPHKLPMELVPGLIKQGKKVIDLSVLIGSDIDCEFLYDTGLIVLGQLKRIDKYGCYHSAANDSPSPRCHIRQDKWMSWQGGSKPVPDGLKVTVITRDGEQHLLHLTHLDWENRGWDNDIIAFKVLGVADGWKYEWEEECV